MYTDSTQKPLVVPLPVKVRIAGRRLRLAWYGLPEWAQIVSVALVICAWLYGALVILFA